MRVLDRWRAASRGRRLLIVALAGGLATVLFGIPGALTAGVVDDAADRIDQAVAESTAQLQADLADAEAETRRVQTELATIVALLEQVDGLGERIAEIRELQARDLAGEDERGSAPPPPSNDDPDPPPDPEPSPSEEPDEPPPDDPGRPEDPGRPDDPGPPEDPGEPEDPVQELVEDLLP